MSLTLKQREEILEVCAEINRAGYQYGYHAGRGEIAEAMKYRDREELAMLGIYNLFKRWEEQSCMK